MNEACQHARVGLCPGCGRWSYGDDCSTFADPLQALTAEEIRHAYRVATELEKEARYVDALIALARCRLAIGLLNSMVCSGERHSDISRQVVATARASIELAVRR
jgi:hypothetical protein